MVIGDGLNDVILIGIGIGIGIRIRIIGFACSSSRRSRAVAFGTKDSEKLSNLEEKIKMT